MVYTTALLQWKYYILFKIVSISVVQHSTVHTPVLTSFKERAHKHTHAHKHTKEEVDEGEDFSKLTSRRLIHLSQPVTPTPSLLPFLFPASLFSIKCQDWPFYNHICDLGSGIQMQSMSIRIMGLLIERGEMVWAISAIFTLTLFLTHIVRIFTECQSWDLYFPAYRLLVLYWQQLEHLTVTTDGKEINIKKEIKKISLNGCFPNTWTAVLIYSN